VSSAADAELHAGDLTAALEGPDLVDVRWGGLDVASRIQVTVRDPEWGTVPPTMVDGRIDRTDGGFRVEIDVSHADDAIAFSWHGSIEANRDGELTFAIEGRSPYPERAAFIDADRPSAGHDIERAADEGLSVVLVSADGSTRVLKPELATH